MPHLLPIFLSLAPANPAGAGDPLLEVFPDAPAASIDDANTTHTATANVSLGTPSGSSWHINAVSAADVFAYKMDSSDSADPSRSWTLRVGKGGQIYSLITDAGEVIPRQWRPEDTQTTPQNAVMNWQQ